MRGFFSNISVQIEEAAWIDGCSKWQAVARVVMPLLLPGFGCHRRLCLCERLNSFLLPLILLTDQKKFTLILGLKSLIGQYTINYGRLSAAGIICLVPAILMFAYIQKHLISGLAAGAVKG
jgi:multiple sugar transport system permease protein